MHIIQSAHNPIIKLLNQLNNNHFRQKHKQTLLEGNHLVNEWVKSKAKNIYCLVLSQDGLSNSMFNPYFNQFKIHVIDNKLWQEITSLPTNDILAVINFADKEFNVNLNSCGVILENIQDSGNMGTIIRTACAANYDWILAIGGASVYSPKVIRAGMGGHLGIEIYQTSLNNLFIVQEQLIKAKTNLLLTMASSAKNIYQIDLPQYHSWLIGSEGLGLSSTWFDLDNITKVSIPQNPKLESLNAASAATICLYEKVRKEFIKEL